MCREQTAWDKGKAGNLEATAKLLGKDAAGTYQKGSGKLW